MSRAAKSAAPAALERSGGGRSSGGTRVSLPAQIAPSNDVVPPNGIMVRVELAADSLGLLRAEIHAAVSEALAAQAAPTEWRDSTAEAQRLGVSRATLDRLAREGMPCCYVGDVRRFRAADVDAWLLARSAAKAGAR